MNQLPRRPLAGIALFFAAGIYLGLNFTLPSFIPLAAGVVLLITSLATIRFTAGIIGNISTAAMLLAIACVGWFHAAMQAESRPMPIASLLSTPTTGIGLIGVLDDDAVPVDAASCRVRTTSRNTSTNIMTWKAPLFVEQLRLSNDAPWQPVGGPAWVRFQRPQQFKPPRYGERWSFSGFLTPGTNATTRNPAHPAPVFMSAGRSAHWIVSGQGNAIIQFALSARTKALEILSYGIARFPEESAILYSLLLGVRGQMPQDIYQAFANTSTLHVFAISGSHVVILAAVLVLALSSGGVPRTRWILALAPVLLLYTIMTGLQSSATRACIMGILFWTAPLLGRQSDIHSSLGAAAMILLSWSPDNLTDAGFLLSFIAVIGLALFTPIFATPFHSHFQKDPLQLQPDPAWKTVAREFALGLGNLVAMTLAATLVTAPLTALYFNSVAPIGLLGNLVAVPLSSLIILTGALSLTFGSCALFFADIFNHANVALAFILNHFIAYLSTIPGGHWKVPPPPLWEILLLYAIMIISRFALWIYTEQKPEGHTDCGINGEDFSYKKVTNAPATFQETGKHETQHRR
jgi:ComEC/Rec2-related protein